MTALHELWKTVCRLERELNHLSQQKETKKQEYDRAMAAWKHLRDTTDV